MSPQPEMRAVGRKALTPEAAWRDLIEKDDRSSPEEYPTMALITQEELAGYMNDLARAAALGAPPTPIVSASSNLEPGPGRDGEAVANLLALAKELCDAVDAVADGVGGSRQALTILREIGPAIAPARKSLTALAAENERLMAELARLRSDFNFAAEIGLALRIERDALRTRAEAAEARLAASVSGQDTDK